MFILKCIIVALFMSSFVIAMAYGFAAWVAKRQKYSTLLIVGFTVLVAMATMATVFGIAKLCF